MNVDDRFLASNGAIADLHLVPKGSDRVTGYLYMVCMTSSGKPTLGLGELRRITVSQLRRPQLGLEKVSAYQSRNPILVLICGYVVTLLSSASLPNSIESRVGYSSPEITTVFSSLEDTTFFLFCAFEHRLCNSQNRTRFWLCSVSCTALT